MSAAHTPGPWWVMESGVRDVGGYICHTNTPTHFPGQDERYANEIEERRKNKILIAAAPDLLAALQWVMSATGEQLTSAFEAAQDAISKATGGQS